MSAPLVLFVYDRLEHTRKTVTALANNNLAEETDLIVYSDGPGSPAKQRSVEEVRAFLPTISGFRNVKLLYREENYGLARSIIEGITATLKIYDRVIVLEDDLVTSPYFLHYMNEALQKYEVDDRVISVHGYLLPLKYAMNETFFMPGADCWGWATWRRGWELFNADGAYLLRELTDRNLLDIFTLNGRAPYVAMLKDQISGRNQSWAVRWYASAILENKLTLYPGRSLVKNIGMDSTGVHCSTTSSYDVSLAEDPILIDDIQVVPCASGIRAFQEFYDDEKRIQQLSSRRMAILRYLKSIARLILNLGHK